MKRLSLLSLLMFIVVAAFAQTRTVEDAKSEALAFLHESANSRHRAKALANVELDLRYTLQRPDHSEAAAYLFQVGDDNGFVLVSAEESARAILAYADEGSFNNKDIPANMKVWLQHYAEEIAWATAHRDVAAAAPSSARRALSGSRIEPLLGDIVWNQGEPFWNDCPYDADGSRCYTGCVATATAQIMRYWQTPAVGSGSHSYIWTRSDGSQQTLSANYAQSHYDWDNMIPNYNDGYNNQQGQAVAKLMSDIGIAIDMQYSSVGSGAYTEVAAQALYKYFGYDASLRAVRPDFVGNDGFAEQMLAELQADRPVLMSGSTTQNEGHAFVCDGFDGEGLFHINWGWGGVQNAYFALSALDPAVQGMGGAASGEGFSVQVLGVMGIKPNAGGAKEEARIGTLGLELVSSPTTTLEQLVVVRINQIHCTGLSSWEGGGFGLAVLDADRNCVGWSPAAIFDEFPVGAYYPGEYDFTCDISFISEDGDYTLAPVFTNKEFSEWWVADVGYDSPKEFAFTVTGNKVVFDVPGAEQPDYSIHNLQAWVEGHTVYFDFESEAPLFHVQVFNDEMLYAEGFIDFKNVSVSNVPDGDWTVWVRPVDAAQTYYLDEAVSTTVTVGDTQTITLELLVNDEQMGYVTGAGQYVSGDEVEITAIPYEGYEFVNWSDGDTNASRTLLLEKTGSDPRTITLTANFQPIPDYSIKNLQAWTEGSTVYFEFESDAPLFHVVVKDNEGNASASGIIDFKTVRVDNVPDGNWIVWVRPVDEAKEHYLDEAVYVEVTVDAPQTITLELLVNDEQMGYVTGAGQYVSGDEVEISATPCDGYEFVNWSDGDTNASRTLLMEKTGSDPRTITLTANFQPIPDFNVYNLQVSVEGSTVLYSFESEASCFEVLLYNDKEVIAAHVIDGKSGSLVGVPDGEWTLSVRPMEDATQENYLAEAATASVTVDTRGEITLVLCVNDESMGKVYGEGVYRDGDTAYINAVANDGYRFVKWDDDSEEPNRSITFEKTAAAKRTVTLTAIFEPEVPDHIEDVRVGKSGTVKYLDKDKVLIKTSRHIYNGTGRLVE